MIAWHVPWKNTISLIFLSSLENISFYFDIYFSYHYYPNSWVYIH